MMSKKEFCFKLEKFFNSQLGFIPKYNCELEDVLENRHFRVRISSKGISALRIPTLKDNLCLFFLDLMLKDKNIIVDFEGICNEC